MAELALPVVVQPGRQQVVEERVGGRVGHAGDVMSDHRAEGGQPGPNLGVGARGPAEAGEHDAGGPAVPVLADKRERGCQGDPQDRSELVGGVGDQPPVAAHDLAVERVERGPAKDVGHRVQPVLERGHHPEVAAAAAQCPEQLGVAVGVAGQELAVGGDHVGRDQVVAQ